MKWLFHFILSHSIFIAFCAAALSLQTLQLLSLRFNVYLLAFIFFATLCGYNCYWMVSRFSFNGHTTLIPFLRKSVSGVFMLLSAVAGMLFSMTHLHLVRYNILLTFILFCLYAIPVMPIKQLHFIRKAGFLKTILLAFTWSIVTILIPLQVSFREMGHAALLIFINRFLFMLMLCIIFDKRDAAVDKIRGLQSLATVIKPLLLHCLFGLIFISYTWITYTMKAYGVTMLQVAALIGTGLITLCAYIGSLQKRGYLYYYFLVDGLMFLSALLTGLAGVYGNRQ
ncbi:MAG: hypothetical protein ABI760_21565 [Ferruginibacter sp.]